MEEIRTNSTLIPTARKVDAKTIVASIRGEIDLHNSPQVRTALLEMLQRHQPTKLVLNLADVPYMDSSAIAVLVEALQRVKKSGGRIFLTNLQPRVRGLLEIARLDTIFSLVANEQEALK
jgi:anti-sigma B factor antagonist